jgi:glyoxylase-like metal-dependent hydrolase (beta-lactamase superfamily II)
MHVDHVGWNTMLVDGRWIPTFPNARYLIARTEYDHWKDSEDELQSAVNSDSIVPIFEAGLADLVEADHSVCEEISLLPTHGHTPGHVSILIESQGETALITGDCVHHPCQIARTDWSSTADSDQTASARTRRALFGRFAETPTLIVGTHFAAPTAGRLKKDGDSFRLDTD